MPLLAQHIANTGSGRRPEKNHITMARYVASKSLCAISIRELMLLQSKISENSWVHYCLTHYISVVLVSEETKVPKFCPK